MKIAVNLLGEPGKMAGTGRYSMMLLKYLVEISTERGDEVLIFAPSYMRGTFSSFSNAVIIYVPSVDNPLVRRIVEQLLLPFYVWINRVCILHSTNNICPLLLFTRNVVTIMDVARWRVRKTTDSISEAIIKTLIKLSAKTARYVFTISEFSKKEIADITHVPANKIYVHKLAVDTDKFTPVSEDKIRLVRKKYDLDKDYIITVSSLEVRKNFVRLVEGFKIADIPCKLVIAGKKVSGYQELVKKIHDENLQNKVALLGYVDDSDLVPLMCGAKFYVFTSVYEGAGLTPLEAMACSKAIVASNIPAVQEYCNGAYEPIDPYDVNSIALGLKLLYTDDILRNKLQANGTALVADLSWRKSIEEIYNVLSSNW